MIVIKIILKLLALPVSLILTLIFWMGIFLINIPGVICHLFSGLCFLLSVSSYLMKISTGKEALTILLTGFGAFLVPVIASWFLARLYGLRLVLSDFIRS